jgi:MOSC domain-containing protein YiiM
MAVLESVNVGTPRAVRWRGRTVTTAIWKAPVAGRVAVRGVNLDGDHQADREVHGGVDKALYAYAAEDYAWWAGQLGHELGPGSFGDNLTTRGLEVGRAVTGERWRVGTALLEVAGPRTPCFKLGIRMGSQRFPRRFAAAGRPGAYLRILEAGEVAAGDPVEVVRRPAHGLTVAEVARIYHFDHARAARLLEAPELADTWKRWASRFTTAPD